MDASTENPSAPGATGSTKALWTLVGVLGVAVLAMGGALVHLQTRPVATPTAVVTPVAVPGAIPLGPDGKPATLGVEGQPLPMVQDGPVPPPRPVAKAMTKSPAPAIRPTPAMAAASAPAMAQAPGIAPTRLLCTVCGTVESVSAVERKPAGTGLGAVAGGVAGNVIERNVKKQTVYRIAVRMEDGSLKTVEKAAPVAVGARVTLDGGSLRTSQGELVPEMPPPASAAPPQAAPDSDRTGG